MVYYNVVKTKLKQQLKSGTFLKI